MSSLPALYWEVLSPKEKEFKETINKQKPYPQCLLDLRNELGCQW